MTDFKQSSHEISLLNAGDVIKAPIPAQFVDQASDLHEDPWRYFIETENTRLLSVDALVQSHVRWDGAERAIDLMRQAYAGANDRRVPLAVRPFDDARFLVIDGNSTLTVAVAAGWAQVPCELVPES